MKLRHFRAVGYRSLKDFDVPVDDFTILIGENNAGKTNLFYALELFLSKTAKGLFEYDFFNRDKDSPFLLTTRFENLAEPEQRKLNSVVPYCKREGIAILAWSPIGKGVLTGKYQDGKRPKDRVRAEEELFKPANLRATAPLIRQLRRIGRDRNKTPGQVALAWLRRHRQVIPIPGAKRPSQAEENAGAAGWSLTGREVRTLGGILRRIRLDTF